MTGNHVYEITDCREATNSNNHMASLRKNWFLKFCQIATCSTAKIGRGWLLWDVYTYLR